MTSNVKPTPGEWAVNPVLSQVDAFNTGNAEPICKMLWPTDIRSERETLANGRLIAEAGNVYNETGLTPRQLAEQRAELLAALEEFDRFNVRPLDTMPPPMREMCQRIKTAINRAKGGA